MEFPAGTRFGPYEISSLLGEGGMGQVYRARDTRLDRTVAIKILPPALAADRPFRDRFDREARVIAQLDHPHICALYDIGQHDGTSYLVLQFLEGETLAARLQRGPLPIAQALDHAIHIADALTRAHRAGIVHRDLKPGNIMLTGKGAVLLDFGLAKTAPAIEASAPTVAALTTSHQVTEKGTILGTFQYMAPEQIEGAEADARSDVWGFGCVLYEMLSGVPAFQGKTPASLIANILNSQPAPPSDRGAANNPALEHLVRRCLEKPPDERWQSMADVASQLRWIATAPRHSLAAPRPAWRQPAVYASLFLLGIAAMLAFASFRSPAAGPRADPLELTLMPPAGLTLTPFGSSGTPHFALSPDADPRIAFVAAAAGEAPSLWIRRLDSRAAQQIPGSQNAESPFWFPDGQTLGFFAEGRLLTIRTDGTRPTVVAKIVDSAGAASNGEVILIGRSSGALLRTSVTGGSLTPATSADADAGGHRWPQFLSDGRSFVYTENRGSVRIGSLDSTTTTEVVRGRQTAVYAPPDWLLFFGGAGKLMAQKFDPRAFTPIGSEREVLDELRYAGGSGFPPVSISARGILAYWDGTTVKTEVEWFDRAGNRLPALPVPEPGRFAISPDGTQIAFSRFGNEKGGSIWLMDGAGNTSRFSFTPDGATRPIWSADGRDILFSSVGRGSYVLLRRPASGTTKEEEIATVQAPDGERVLGEAYALDWSADGRTVLFASSQGATVWDIMAYDIERGRLTPVVQTPAYEIQARLSPDGRWIAYATNEAGPWEVFVEPFPPTGAKWQVSTNGGSQPAWRRDGRELFYLAPDAKLMGVDITPGAAFTRSAPKALFQTRIRPTYPPYPINYDVSPDGQRFLIEGVRPDTGPTISIVVNWSLRE